MLETQVWKFGDPGSTLKFLMKWILVAVNPGTHHLLSQPAAVALVVGFSPDPVLVLA